MARYEKEFGILKEFIDIGNWNGGQSKIRLLQPHEVL